MKRALSVCTESIPAVADPRKMSPDDREDLPSPPAVSVPRGPFWIAVCATVFTLPLLYVGGSVTTYRVGLAVPDWPQTFGINMFLYDFWNAPFGVRIEHTHRLYGAPGGDGHPGSGRLGSWCSSRGGGYAGWECSRSWP